jgi:hypothetical protein
LAAIPGWDATTSNVIHLPRGQHAGYTSGRGIAWTPAQWAADPSAIRIAQSSALAVDESGWPDVLDYEAGAATLADVGPWAKAMLAAYAAGSRPGQRRPAIYASKSNLTHIVNALIAAGVKSGIGLWIAEWGIGKAAAEALVNNASGPFPVIGVQYSDDGTYDSDVFSAAWLKDVSVKPGTPKPGPVPSPVPAPAPYPVPTGLAHHVGSVPVRLEWKGTGPHWRYQVHDHTGKVILSGVVTVPYVSIVLPTGDYAWRVQAAGDSPFTPWEPFTV